MGIKRIFHLAISKLPAQALTLALVAWGVQAIASEQAMKQMPSMDTKCGSGMDMHSTDQGGMHDMQGMSDPMSADLHAHHREMMQRQGYDRSMHAYTAPDLSLIDMNGKTTSLRESLDTTEPVLMNFIFTTCTTICPVLTSTFSQIQQQLGAEAEQIRMISITIDPQQDTPQQLKVYAEHYGAGSHWQFLTGEIDNIVAVQKAFDIYRGSKTNHEPITLLRGAGANSWVRIDGIASAADIIGEYRALAAVDK
jgi:protein SCO1